MVTWATSGLGRAGAVAFGRAQAAVIVNHLPGDDGTAAEVVREIEREGGRAAAIAADVSDEKHVQAMFEETVARFGTVNVLVNNAESQSGGGFKEMKPGRGRGVRAVKLEGQSPC